MMRALFIIFLFSSTIDSLFAQNMNCLNSILEQIIDGDQIHLPQQVMSKPFMPSKSFWNQTEEVSLIGPNGEKLPIRFSFDVELPYKELYKLLKEDAKSWSEFQQHFSKNNFFREDLIKLFNLSEKQFDAFALPKGFPKDKKIINITELNSLYFAIAVEKRKLVFSSSDITPIVDDFMKRRGLPIHSHDDLGYVELTHNSSEGNPQKFALLMKNLEKKFPTATFHLHVSLPSQAVTEDQLLSIARAIESKTILSLNGNEQPLSHHYFSSLRNKYSFVKDYEERGIIRAGIDDFDKPVVAHNLEVRQFTKMDNGLDLISFASQLAQNRKSIIHIDPFTVKRVQDIFTGNLNGNVKYLGLLLSRSNKPEQAKLGQQLLMFYDKIKNNISIEDRREIYQFMKKNNIKSLLDETLFLNYEP